MMNVANLPALVQRFFTEWLQSQLGASPHTIASYRDTFRLLLLHASEPCWLHLPSAARLGHFLAKIVPEKEVIMLRNIAAAVKEVVVGWARSIGDAIKRQVEPARTAVGAVARAGCDAVRPRDTACSRSQRSRRRR